jgi:hypothetical protein
MVRRSFVAAVLIVFAAAAWPFPLRAWNDRGHMLVAFIAFRHLTPKAKTEVGRLLQLNPQYKAWIKGLPPSATDEDRALTAFLQASRWPDFIKGASKYVSDGPDNGNTPPSDPSASQNIGYADLNRHKYWHFKDAPFSDDGTATQPPPGVNAQSEIELMSKALGAPATSDDVKSYDLVWLVHLVGDVHQPLHAISRFTKPQPAGDAGGGLLKLSCKPPVMCEGNLHAQWDRLLGMSTDPGSIAKSGTELDTMLNPPGGDNADVNVWMQESVELAKSAAYRSAADTPLPAPKAFLTTEYLKRAGGVGQLRVVLGGRRLAKIVNDALGQ